VYLWICNFYSLKSTEYLQDNFSVDIFSYPQTYKQIYPQAGLACTVDDARKIFGFLPKPLVLGQAQWLLHFQSALAVQPRGGR